jgi:membrane-associated phospholipid phosphatase
MTLDCFGQPAGVLVPCTLALALTAMRRWWSLLYFATAYLGGTMVVVQFLKHAVDRTRPLHPLVPVDEGPFPSEHSFAAALLVVLVGVVLVPPVWRGRWWLLGSAFVLVDGARGVK